jgi:quercetin dioxygenase-like cupin family protein
MKITRFTEAPMKSPSLDARVMHTSGTLEVVHLHLFPGQEVPQHVNPIDAILCLIEGQVTCKTGDKSFIINLFDTLEIAAGEQRGLFNHTVSDVRILVLKKLK